MNLQAFDKVLNQEDLFLAFSPDWVDSLSIRNALPNLTDITKHVGGLSQIDLTSSPMIIDGEGGISVSHSKSGGAILVSKGTKNIGIDLEERSRLTEKVLNRVSSETERKSAPNLHFLWPAKEASFKALYPDNDDISIPEVIIQNWEKFDDDVWSFSAHYEQKTIKGFLFSDEFLLVAAAFI